MIAVELSSTYPKDSFREAVAQEIGRREAVAGWFGTEGSPAGLVAVGAAPCTDRTAHRWAPEGAHGMQPDAPGLAGTPTRQ